MEERQHEPRLRRSSSFRNEWLTSTSGWSTSQHISKAIHEAKAAGVLRPITSNLFYAADLADRVANVIVPTLERGEFRVDAISRSIRDIVRELVRQ